MYVPACLASETNFAWQFYSPRRTRALRLRHAAYNAHTHTRTKFSEKKSQRYLQQYCITKVFTPAFPACNSCNKRIVASRRSYIFSVYVCVRVIAQVFVFSCAPTARGLLGEAVIAAAATPAVLAAVVATPFIYLCLHPFTMCHAVVASSPWRMCSQGVHVF